MGLGLLGDVETIKIEHIFTFNLGEKWERPLRKTMGQWMDVCTEYAESFRFIAVGIGSYFFLLGISKVIEAGRDHRNVGGGSGGGGGGTSGGGGGGEKNVKRSGDGASVRSSRTNRSSRYRSTGPAPPPTSEGSVPTTITLGDGSGDGTRFGLNPSPPATIREESESPPPGDEGNEGGE